MKMFIWKIFYQTYVSDEVAVIDALYFRNFRCFTVIHWMTRTLLLDIRAWKLLEYVLSNSHDIIIRE